MNKCCNGGNNQGNRGCNFGTQGFIILVLFILLAIIASTMFNY